MPSTSPAIRTGSHAILLRRRLAQGTALAGLLTGASALALPDPRVPALPIPVGGTIQAEGIANISTDSSVTNPKMTVDLLTPGGRTVIDWKSFDIGATETVHFTDALAQPGAVAVLNRVVGPNGDFSGVTQSRIMGTLSSDSNVSVFLLNQQGILFGAGSRVQVGSLIASTLPIDESAPDATTGTTHQRAFLTGNSRTFRGASSSAIEIENTANLEASGARGVIALVGARIENAGMLTARGEVVLVTASDATINFDPASPLSIVIREGASLANPMVLRGTVNGSSILIAGATRDDVTASVLNVQATLTATAAYTTDQGIVLVAGRTAALPDTVTMPTIVPAAAPLAATGNAGGMALELGGIVQTKSGGAFAAGPIDIRAADGIRTVGTSGAAALTGAGSVQVQADRGAITLGRIVGTTVAIGGTAAVGTLDIVASGDVGVSGTSVTLGRATTSAGAMTLTATGGDLSATAAGAAGDLTLRADGAIRIGTGTAGALATIAGQTNVTIDTLEAATIAISAQDGLTANRLTATRASSTDSVLTATAGTLAIGIAAAPNAGVSLTTTTGAATVGTILAGRDGTLDAAARATLTGGATVGRDLAVRGTDVRLGGTVPATQQAGRTASYTATTAMVAGATGATGLTIRADAAGAGTGSVLLDAATGIDMTGVALVTGDPAGTVTSGDVGIRLSGAAPLTLGTTDARALLSVADDHATFTPLTVTGAVTLGATRLVDGLALSTPGAIRLGGIAISGAGQALEVTGTGNATTIAATGTLSASGGVTVRAPGAVLLADVAGGTAATIASTGAALTANVVSGGIVIATARDALVLDRVTATATGAATLTSQTAGIRVTGATQAGGQVTIDAPGDIGLGDVRSTTATLRIESTGTPATGTLRAGAVRTATDLAITRAGDFRLGSATSDGGAVRLTSTAGTVTVDGATKAQGLVSIDGAALGLGAVESVDATVSLLSRTGTVSAGTLLARGRVSVLGESGVTLAGVTSRASTADIFANGGAIRVTGAIGTAGAIASGTSGDADYGDVTSRDSTVTLTASGGSLTTGAVRANGFAVLTAEQSATIASAASTTDYVSIAAATGSIAVAGAIAAGTVVIADGYVDTRLGSVTASGIGTSSLRARTGLLTVIGRTATVGRAELSGYTGVGTGAVAASAGSVDIRSMTGAIGTGALSGTDIMVETPGNAGIASLTTTTGAGSIRAGGDATVTGAVSTGGRFDAVADGALDLGDVTSRGDSVVLQAGTALQAGAVMANTALTAISGTRAIDVTVAGLTLGSARSDTSDVTLRSPWTINVLGTTIAGAAVDVLADGGVTLGDVTATGAGVSLISNGAAVNAGEVRARQMVDVGAATDIVLGSATSEAANIRLLSGRDMTVRGVVQAESTIVARSGAAMGLRNVTSDAGAIMLTSDGGTVTAGAVRARDGLGVLAATDVTLAGATSDAATIALTATAGAVRVTAATVAAGDVTAIGATTIAMGDVTSRGAGVALLSGGGSVRAGGVTAATALDVTAATGIALGSATSQTGTVRLATAVGTLGVTGATQARGDVTIDAEDMIRLGDVTSETATVAILSRAGSAGAGTILAAQAVRVTGQRDVPAAGGLPAQAGVSLVNATATGGPVALTAVAGGVTATGMVRAAGDVVIDARDAVALGIVKTDPGAVTIGSRAGTITAGTIDAGGGLTAVSNGTMTLTQVDTRNGAADLRSAAGDIRITAIRTGTTLDATAAQTLAIDSATVGTSGSQRMAATLAARTVEIGTIEAGSLDVTANDGALTLGVGDSVGLARLTKTGANGAITITRLTAGGPTWIDSAGAVRADRLEGGAAVVVAGGDVTGRPVAGLFGALQADVAELRVVAGGSTMIGTVTTRGDATVIAAGAIVLNDRIETAGDLTVTGGGVLLGNAARAVRQAAAGTVRITGATGGITGLAGLTLVSDAGGAGGRDLTLVSAGGIRFGTGSTLLGGSDRQSAVRVGAGPAAAITLDAVVARTIASPGAGDVLTHDGAVTIASATTRDSLAIALTGMATPLTIGTATVSTGDLSLESAGALDAGRLTAAAGTVTLAAASVRNDMTIARGVTATARTGTATFDRVDATAGAIVATAATDLRIARATASDAVQLTSLRGDVTGAAATGGFGAAMLTGDRVTVRADAGDGIAGLVRIATVSGTNGVDLAGRTIIADSVRAAAGAVTIDTRRDSAGSVDQRLAIGTIDAGGGITLRTGNRLTRADGSIAIDRATSSGGAIRIETIAGGIASRDPAVRTVLTAPAGTIDLDIDGVARLGTVTAGPALTIAATSLEIGTATAAGPVTLATRSGPLTLGTVTADGALAIDTVGSLAAGTIEAAAVTLATTGDATLGRVQARSGAIGMTIGGALDAAALDGATDVTATAATARITDVGARGGALSLTARSGRLRVDSARAATDALLTAPTLSIGTLASGRAAVLAAGADMDVSGLTAGTTMFVDAGRDATITTADAGGDVRLSAGRQLTVARLGTPAAVTLSGQGVSVTDATAGTLAVAAGTDGLVLTGADVAGPALLQSGGAIAIGSLAAGDATLSAVTGLIADQLTLGTTLAAEAGADMTVGAVRAGAAVTLASGATLMIGGITTPSALALTGRRIAVTRADVGQLQAAAGAGGIDARGIGASDAVAIRSDADIAIGTLDAGSATLVAAGQLAADRLTTRTTLSATAGTAMTIATIGAGGDVGLRGAERVALGTVTTPAGLMVAGRGINADALAAGTLDLAAGGDGAVIGAGVIGDTAMIGSDADIAIGTLDTGSATLVAAEQLAADRLTTRTTLSATAGTTMTIATIGAGGDVELRGADGVALGTVATPMGLMVAGRGIAVNALAAGTLDLAAGVDGAGIGTGTVGDTAMIWSDTDIAIGTLDAGSATLVAAGQLAADRLTTRTTLSATAGTAMTIAAIGAGGDVELRGAERVALGTVATPAGLMVAGRGIAVDALAAGMLDLAAGVDGAVIGAGVVGGTAMIGSDADIAIGTLDAGSATLVAAGMLTADRLTTRTALSATAGTAMTIAAIGAGGDVVLRGAERVALGTVATPAGLMVAGRGIAVDALAAGTLDLAAGIDGAGIGAGAVGGMATIGSDAGIAVGTLDAGSAAITAAGGIDAERLTLADGLTATATGGAAFRTVRAGGAVVLTGERIAIGTLAAGRAEIAAATEMAADRLTTTGTLAAVGDAVRIASLQAGGDVTLTGTRLVTVDSAATPAAMTLRGAQVAVATLDAGTLAVTAGAAGLDLRTARVAGLARIGSDAGAAIGGLDAGSIDLMAAGTVAADRLAARAGLGVTALGATIGQTLVTGGTARIVTGTGGLMLGTMTAAGDTALATTGVLDAGTIAIDGGLTAEAASTRFATMTVARDAALTARTGELRIGTATLGGAGRYRGPTVVIGSSTSGGALAIAAVDRIAAETLEVGGALAIETAALALGTATVRGGDAVLTLGRGQIDGITGTAGVRLAVADALAATRLDAGGGLDVRAGSATIAQAAARGGDVTLAATGPLTLGTATASGAVALTSNAASRVTGAVSAGGAYRITAASIALGTAGATTRQAGAEVTMVARNGTIAAAGATTLAAGRALSLTADGAGGGIAFAPETVLNSTGTGIALATTGTATLGTVQAATGEIRVAAADVALTRAVSATSVVLANVATAGITRLGDSAVGNEGAFGTAGGGFDLSNGEIALVAAPTMTIASGPRDVVVGAVGLGAATGATRFAITTRGRIDMLGRFVAAGSTAARTIAIGGDGAGGRSGVLRIAATQAAGGRLLVDGAVLTLSAERIGAGLDRDFLDPLGYRASDGLSVEQVTRDYVARPTSTLYASGAFGAAPYGDGVILRSGTLTLEYGRYALFQNTALPGQQRGVEIGSATPGGPGGTALRLSTTGSAANAFALFGTINGIGSAATALLGGETLAVDGTASPVASRINGCVIGSGGGCLNSSIAQPSLNLFDTSRAEIVRTADDLSLPFDPLIGTNNEALYLDTSADAAAASTACEGDTPCPTQP